MELSVSKKIYANVLGGFMVLALVSMYFDSAPGTLALVIIIAASVTAIRWFLAWFDLISTSSNSLPMQVENFAWTLAFPALFVALLGAPWYSLILVYSTIYLILRFGPDKISLTRLRGEVIFWSNE